MRLPLVLLAISLAACSRREPPPTRREQPPPAPPTHVVHVFASPLYDENILVACLETRSETRPDGGIAQPCSSFGKHAVATCTFGPRRLDYYVPFEDDLESRDCIAEGGTWRVDEKEMARAEREQRRKKALKVADELQKKYGSR